MNKFLMMYYNVIGSVYIPETLKKLDEEKLLHISDTPICFFSTLKYIIKKISPEIIIHTGDLVDDIKLEIYRNSLSKYDYHVRNIISIMEASKAKEIYISIGNHDNIDVINKYCKRSTIIDKMDKTVIFGDAASISHFPYEIIKNPSTYNFYGHDISLKSDIVKDKIYFNGIKNINIITKNTKRIFYLPYPSIVDDARLMKRKIGL